MLVRNPMKKKSLGVGWHEKESKAETQVHGALKAAYYDAFRAVRQIDNHGTITARDNYELTRNLPKCVGVECLCEGANIQIPFNADEVNLIYQFGEQSKAEKNVCGTDRHPLYKG